MKSAKFERVKIIAHSDNKYSKKIGEYEVLVNPEKLSMNFNVDYQQNETQGTSGQNLKFEKMSPGDLELNLLFDSTGVLGSSGILGIGATSNKKKVPDQIEEFQKVVYDFQGETHQPSFVMIVWGKIIFKGRLTTFSIDYTVMGPDGVPLRATGKATFKESISNDKRCKEEKKKSPDITHLRIIKAGDKLSSIANEVYGDPRFYTELARFNQLTHYRNLIPGTKIVLPPLNKSDEI